MNYKNKFFIIIIIFQLAVIYYLLMSIHNKQKNVLGEARINTIKRESVIASPSVELKYFFEPKPNSTTMSDEWKKIYKGVYKINSDGLREEHEYSVDKPVGTYRIITLGDSFTYGVLVDIENIWPKLLEKRLNALNCSGISNFEVTNLGVGGYDTQYAVQRFKLRGQKYNPDLILWFLKDDDFIWINEIMLKNSKNIEKQMKENGEYDKATKEGNLEPVWTKMLEEMGEKYKEIGDEKIIKMQKESLSQLRMYYKGNLVIFTLPTTATKWTDLMKSFANLNSNTFYFNKIRNIYELKATFLPKDGHPNEKGHKIIADDLFEYLITKRLIPCN